jgi:creatinine amidohydrolase
MVLERKVELERMTSKEAGEAVRESNGVVLIPVGAIENHGPGLPLNTDNLYTVEVARRAAEQVGVVVAPLVPWGNTIQQMDFPGSIHISNRTLIGLVEDIGRSLARHGFDKLVVLNGHGGNVAPLDIACEQLKYDTRTVVCNIAVWELAEVPAPDGTPEADGHGGSQELSTDLALSPEDVDLASVVKDGLRVRFPPSVAPWPAISMDGPIHIFAASSEMTEFGIFGDPAFASAERGELVISAWTEVLVAFLKQLRDGEVGPSGIVA